MDYLYLIIAIISKIITTIFLKALLGFSKMYPSAITIIKYTISFTLFSLTLKTIPISTTYSYWSRLILYQSQLSNISYITKNWIHLQFFSIPIIIIWNTPITNLLSTHSNK